MADLPQLLNLLLSLAFVLALMGGFAFVLKKLGLAQETKIKGDKRLKVLESLPLDARRRLVLIARDDKQHLVILGPNSETLIETDIPARGAHETVS